MGGSGTLSLVTSLFGTQTVTRTELRRAICQELHMPFMRRTNGYSVVGANPTTTTITDTNLAQEDDYWKGQWWYNVTQDHVRKIVRFIASSDTLKFEYPVAIPVAGNIYEIHSIFNAFEIHGAINRAIEDAFPAFFDYISDYTNIIQEDTLRYQISNLIHVPWKVTKVWVEHNEEKITGTATSGGASTLTDSGSKFGEVTSGWLVSIYGGTGTGQIRIVDSATATEITVTSAWTTNPDSTSKYMVWDPSSETMQWEQVLSARFDSKEYPTYLYLTKSFPNSIGLRMRLEYITRPIPLVAESSTTVVPKEFIINKALSILFGQKVNDNRADRNRFANLEEYRRQLAEQYRAARAFEQPSITVWQPSKTLLSYSNMENPF